MRLNTKKTAMQETTTVTIVGIRVTYTHRSVIPPGISFFPDSFTFSVCAPSVSVSPDGLEIYGVAGIVFHFDPQSSDIDVHYLDVTEI